MFQTLHVYLGLLLVSLSAHAGLPVDRAQTALDIPKFFKVDDGVFRGAQPEDEIDYDFLKAHGVKSILNLRRTKAAIRTEGLEASKRGMGFLSVPMKSFFSPGNKAVNAALAFVTDPANQPVFVHCRKGKDRTGLVIGLYRVHVQGWDPHEAYKEMRSFGFNPWLVGLEHMYWKRAKATPDDAILARDDLGHGFAEDEDLEELGTLPEAAW